jgi:putative transcriptional regulator
VERVEASFSGRLLVAAPSLLDPNFARTVVLILDHDEDGALGIVLNRPSEVDVADVLPGWEQVTAAPTVLFGGGPVEPTAVIGLGRARGAPPEDGWEPITGRIRAVDPTEDPSLTAIDVDVVRLFAGYAGWGPGQLEAELDDDAWFVLDPRDDDPFSDQPDRLWHRVFERQGGELRLLATFPADPSLN